jgi:hypothetical protein
MQTIWIHQLQGLTYTSFRGLRACIHKCVGWIKWKHSITSHTHIPPYFYLYPIINALWVPVCSPIRNPPSCIRVCAAPRSSKPAVAAAALSLFTAVVVCSILFAVQIPFPFEMFWMCPEVIWIWIYGLPQRQTNSSMRSIQWYRVITSMAVFFNFEAQFPVRSHFSEFQHSDWEK